MTELLSTLELASTWLQTLPYALPIMCALPLFTLGVGMLFAMPRKTGY